MTWGSNKMMKLTKKEKETIIVVLIEVIIFAVTLIGVYYENPWMMFYGVFGLIIFDPTVGSDYDAEEDR